MWLVDLVLHYGYHKSFLRCFGPLIWKKICGRYLGSPLSGALSIRLPKSTPRDLGTVQYLIENLPGAMPVVALGSRGRGGLGRYVQYVPRYSLGSGDESRGVPNLLGNATH